MNYKTILITGGAGFVGSNLAVKFKQHFENINVIAFDNLKRRGSELNIRRLKENGVAFVHGDIRCTEDLNLCGKFDLLIDCSAEPSVHAGMNKSPKMVININLSGTLNCMEVTRINSAAFLFLSTSRVYPIEKLNSLSWEEGRTRFEWTNDNSLVGFSENGVSESFPIEGVRSIYGATKLAAELLLQEYAFAYQMPVLINRCGIIAGPWQMGKVEQGVVTLWVASHFFKKNLSYIGFGGTGKQVRDMIHILDLFDLIVKQIETPGMWDGRVYNIGGGRQVSASLYELTQLCADVTGNEISIRTNPTTSAVDLRIYITDARKAIYDFSWKPERSVSQIVEDTASWIVSNESRLKSILG